MGAKKLIVKCASTPSSGQEQTRAPRLVLAGLLSICIACGLHGQDAKSAQAALHLMPLPRSLQVGTGKLAIDSHFKATIIGDHDQRLDAALDRMITRLDRHRSEEHTSELQSPMY